jgi:hypothetical protein
MFSLPVFYQQYFIFLVFLSQIDPKLIKSTIFTQGISKQQLSTPFHFDGLKHIF